MERPDDRAEKAQADGAGEFGNSMRSRTRMKQGKAFIAIVCPQTHPLSTCSALSRQVGAIKLSDCLFPPHAQPCNLFLYLAARHVTFVSQLYSIVLLVFFDIHHFSFSRIRDKIEA